MPSFEIASIGTVWNGRADVRRMDDRGAVRSTVTIDEWFAERGEEG